ncbi:MAG: TonB-dependent receptor [Cytophagaceae bacterium]
MKKVLLVIFLFPVFAFAQNIHTIKGQVRDAEFGFGIGGASIVVSNTNKVVYSDEAGFYKMNLAEGNYTLVVTSLGYDTLSKKVNITEDTELDFMLKEESFVLEEVQITGDAVNQNIRSTEMGTVKLDIAQIRELPVLFGETDILKTLTLMPGVQTTTDGATGLYVRGGGPDQNLVLIDDAPVYNPAHLLGFFSVFNGDALQDVKLYKGGIPPTYGGRLSSVVDVTMRNGNRERFSASGGIGLISSRLTLEGPIVKEKGSFLLSGRRTYADVFLKLSANENLRNSTLHFYDLNLKADYQISEKDRIFLSGYYGRDVFRFGRNFGFDWGNAASTLRWNHRYNEKFVQNTSLIFSNYDYSFNIAAGDFDITLLSGIQSYNVKSDWDYMPNRRNHIKFGVSSIYHRFNMPSFRSNIAGLEEFNVPSRYALENGIYAQNDFVLNSKVSINYGLRYSLFNLMGPGDVYSFDENRENVTDTTTYNRGQFYKNYGGLEPRLAITYIVDPRQSVKVSYNRMRQYIHLLSNSAASSPTDLWIPAGNVVSPQIGDQISAGYFRNIKEGMYEASVEVYYKDMQNQIDYKNGANITFNPTIETELLFGRGYAYGSEFLIRKNKGRLTGWIGYTLSRSFRQIEGINQGLPFPARYDRIHDVSVVTLYKLSQRWRMSGTWVYATGNPVTFPEGKYEYEGRIVNFYTGRNEYRMPSYHRMDLSFTHDRPARKHFQSSWNFSVYNVYARQNPFLITFRDSEADPEVKEAVQVALFQIIPSVTWNFKF